MLTVEVLLVLAEMNAKTSKLAKNIHFVRHTERLLLSTFWEAHVHIV